MTPISVLLVEDSIVVRAVVRSQLVAAGHDVRETSDGLSALEACRALPPDVVLLDVQMPGMSGWEVLAAMRKDAALADVPVVFLTGLTETADLVEGLRLGAHDYLRKPFEPAELLARVAAAARVTQLQKELRRRNEELESLSRTDTLTGLPNRRHLLERLAALTSLSDRHAAPMAVLTIDVDHFKWVNDLYGHAAGDAVLRDLATRLASRVRAGEMVGRWGGEEFLVVLPMTDAAGATATAEQLRQIVAGEPYQLPDGETVKVTISLGCAASTASDTEALLRSADAALYDAKRSGRNRAVLARSGALPPRPAVSDDEPVRARG